MIFDYENHYRLAKYLIDELIENVPGVKEYVFKRAERGIKEAEEGMIKFIKQMEEATKKLEKEMGEK